MLYNRQVYISSNLRWALSASLNVRLRPLMAGPTSSSAWLPSSEDELSSDLGSGSLSEGGRGKSSNDITDSSTSHRIDVCSPLFAATNSNMIALNMSLGPLDVILAWEGSVSELLAMAPGCSETRCFVSLEVDYHDRQGRRIRRAVDKGVDSKLDGPDGAEDQRVEFGPDHVNNVNGNHRHRRRLRMSNIEEPGRPGQAANSRSNLGGKIMSGSVTDRVADGGIPTIDGLETRSVTAESEGRSEGILWLSHFKDMDLQPVQVR